MTCKYLSSCIYHSQWQYLVWKHNQKMNEKQTNQKGTWKTRKRKKEAHLSFFTCNCSHHLVCLGFIFYDFVYFLSLYVFPLCCVSRAVDYLTFHHVFAYWCYYFYVLTTIDKIPPYLEMTLLAFLLNKNSNNNNCAYCIDIQFTNLCYSNREHRRKERHISWTNL